MRSGANIRAAHQFALLGLMLALLTSTFASADVGRRHTPTVIAPGRGVLLPYQSPYSLAYAAEVTAYFNTLGATTGRTVNEYPKNLPFQLLYEPPVDEKNNTGGEGTTFYVRSGALLYVPVLSIPIPSRLLEVLKTFLPLETGRR